MAHESINHTTTGESLYFAWRLDSHDPGASRQARALLARGQVNRLYRLRSWVVVNDEARALVVPEVSLDEIAGAIWNEHDRPVKSRWIQSRRACAALSREIESRPVALGLATRPEEWPYSSAARD